MREFTVSLAHPEWADQHSWFEVDASDRNMDVCPELRPCPTCGSVWVELTAVGVRDPHITGRLDKSWINLDLRTVAVTVPGTYFQEIVAARVECAEGHSYETDGHRYTRTPSWKDGVDLTVSLDAVVYTLGKPGRGRIRKAWRVR
jgi:hypothetical protein